MSSGVKVFAPASISNLSCGFDQLGLALNEPGDEVIVRLSGQPGVRITRITGDRRILPYEADKNTAGIAALKLLEFLGESKLGVEMELHKKMPIGSGLGSSAASAVAALVAVNDLLKNPLEKRALLPFAAEAEKIGSGSTALDNIAASLIGGIVLVQNKPVPSAIRLPSPDGLYVAVVYPHVEILTKASRQALRTTIPLEKHVEQSARLGSFIVGLYQSDIELIRHSLVDVIIEEQRAPSIPYFYDVKNAAMEIGALGCSISGSGPSIFALCPNSYIAGECVERMSRIYSDGNISFSTYLSPINREGAMKI